MLLTSNGNSNQRDVHSYELPSSTATTASLRPTAATIWCAASTTSSCQTLLPTRAIGTGVAALAVIAERALAGIRSRLLSITALRLSLVLVEIAATGLVLICSYAVLLGPASPVLLIEVGLVSACALLSQISLTARALLPHTCLRGLVSILGLIELLVEMRR